ncbi:hypothetical protein [Persicobacter diffluens]|uniref:hypothetical protein n=1 Tax=Persicobacter diffluens TaxID=981 RepID=UPI0030C6E766
MTKGFFYAVKIPQPNYLCLNPDNPSLNSRLAVRREKCMISFPFPVISNNPEERGKASLFKFMPSKYLEQQENKPGLSLFCRAWAT